MSLSKENVKKRIVIASPDVLGPISNGGVGTACAALAENLVAAGFEVDLLFAHFGGKDAVIKKWTAFYKRKGIHLHFLPRPDYEHQHGHYWVRVSYAVYEWLKPRSYDLAIFPDMFGVGHYSLIARRAGLTSFQKTPMVVMFLGPQVWSREDNNQLFSGMEELTIPMLEKSSVENADLVQFATDWSQKWADERNWKYNDCQKVLFPMPKVGTVRKGKKSARAQEIIFFGRLESRKGITEFLEAIELMNEKNELRHRQITLLGSDGHFGGQRTSQMIKEWQTRTGIRLKIITTMQSSEAITYIRDRNAVAVIASRSETMGYTLLECLAYGIPCLFSDIEPFLEITGRTKHPAMFRARSASSIREAILADEPLIDVARAKKLLAATASQWLTLVNKAMAIQPPGPGAAPKIAVLITHHERANYLRDALESILKQTLLPAEVLIYDDASTSREHEIVVKDYQRKFALQHVPLTLVQGKVNCGPGQARNLLAKKAKSEFLLFMDDDNIALPYEMSFLSRMQSTTGADVVTTAMVKIFDGQADLWAPRVWTPVGFDLSASTFENQMGDTNFLVRRSLFFKAGGFDKSPTLYAEDMNLLVRLAKIGARMWVCPEPLFVYRVHGFNRSRKMDLHESRLRNLKAHFAATSGMDMTGLAHVLLAWSYERNFAWMNEPAPKIRYIESKERPKNIQLTKHFLDSVIKKTIVIPAQEIRKNLKLKNNEAFYLHLNIKSSSHNKFTATDDIQEFVVIPGQNSILVGVPGHAEKIELSIAKPATVRISRARLLKVPPSRIIQRLGYLGLDQTLQINLPQ